MQKTWTLPLMALATFLMSSGAAFAQDQNNTPTDPTAPGGGTCTGFPGDPANCPRQDQQNTTIPEQPADPDVNTQSGPTQTTPDVDTQQPLPNGAAPDDGTQTPAAP